MSQDQQFVLLFGMIPLVLCTVFTAIGVLRKRMARDWVPTTGQVINRRGDPLARKMAASNPTFRWRDASGVEHRRTSMVNASLGPGPGKLVRVKYDPKNPSRAVIDSFVQSGTFFTFIGIGIGVLGIFGVSVAFWMVSSGLNRV